MIGPSSVLMESAGDGLHPDGPGVPDRDRSGARFPGCLIWRALPPTVPIHAAGTPQLAGQAEKRRSPLRLDRDQDAGGRFAEERGVGAELAADLDRAAEPVGRMEGAFGRGDGQPAFRKVVGGFEPAGLRGAEADFLDGLLPIEVEGGDRPGRRTVDDFEIFRAAELVRALGRAGSGRRPSVRKPGRTALSMSWIRPTIPRTGVG